MARGFSRCYDRQAAITSQPLQHAPSSASLVLFLVGACAKDPTQRSLCRRRGRRKQENRHKVVTSAQYLREVDCTIAVCHFWLCDLLRRRFGTSAKASPRTTPPAAHPTPGGAALLVLSALSLSRSRSPPPPSPLQHPPNNTWLEAMQQPLGERQKKRKQQEGAPALGPACQLPVIRRRRRRPHRYPPAVTLVLPPQVVVAGDNLW